MKTGSTHVYNPIVQPQRIFDESQSHHEYLSLEEFLATDAVPNGYHTVHYGGLPIDFFAEYRGHRTTFYSFHANVRPHRQVPVFTGAGISYRAEANRVYFSDPSLVLTRDLTLAWFVGNAQQDLQDALVRIIGHLEQVYQSQKGLFFGASGGGFAALFYASRFPGSTAVVCNPQTNITRYEEPAPSKFARICFGVEGDWAMDRLPVHVVTNLVSVYSEPKHVRILYMQNETDTHHIDHHLHPFVESLNKQNELWLNMGSWGQGHIAPPKPLILETVTAAASGDIHKLEALGFTPQHSSGEEMRLTGS